MPNNNNAPEFIGREALTHVAEQVGICSSARVALPVVRR